MGSLGIPVGIGVSVLEEVFADSLDPLWPDPGDGSGIQLGGFDQIARHHPRGGLFEERGTWEYGELFSPSALILEIIGLGANIAQQAR